MTTAKTPRVHEPGFQLPEPEKSQDEKTTANRHLSLTGGAHALIHHLGKSETTVVGCDLYLALIPPALLGSMSGLTYPDLFIAFDADPAGYLARNGYVISEQGKPPDFILEVASRSTGRRDTIDKRVAYAALGVPEYWRFDETGEFHGARLAGDQLVNGRYAPIDIEQLPDGNLQGYSTALNLNLRWENGQLAWYDPETEKHIPRLEDAEARIRDLEETIRRLRGE